MAALAIFVATTQLTSAQSESSEQGIVFVINADQTIPNPSLGGSNPNGTGAFVINADGSEVGFTFTYSDLTGPPTAMHFHNAAAGESGGVAQKICGQGPQAGLISSCPSGNSGTVAGVWQIPSASLTNLLNGNLYVNIHTSTNGGGEVRGQMSAAE